MILTSCKDAKQKDFDFPPKFFRKKKIFSIQGEKKQSAPCKSEKCAHFAFRFVQFRAFAHLRIMLADRKKNKMFIPAKICPLIKILFLEDLTTS